MKIRKNYYAVCCIAILTFCLIVFGCTGEKGMEGSPEGESGTTPIGDMPSESPSGEGLEESEGQGTASATVTAPQVLNTTPENDSVNVSSYDTQSTQKKLISITFDKEMDPSGISTNALVLSPSVNIESVDQIANAFNFTLAKALDSKTDYSATLKKNGIKDLSGNEMEDNYQWSFKTIDCGNGVGQLACDDTSTGLVAQKAKDFSKIVEVNKKLKLNIDLPFLLGEEYVISPIGYNRHLDAAIHRSTDPKIKCPAGQGVVGIEVRGGGYIDQISKICCKSLYELDSELSPDCPNCSECNAINMGIATGVSKFFKAEKHFVMTGLKIKSTEPWINQLAVQAHLLNKANGALYTFDQVSLINEVAGAGENKAWVWEGSNGDGNVSWVPALCPDGFFMRGISGVGGAEHVLRLGVVCQRIVPKTANGYAFEPQTIGTLSKYQGYEFGPLVGDDSLGGEGGGYFEAKCPEGMVVKGIRGRAGHVVDTITRLWCFSYEVLADKSKAESVGTLDAFVDIVGGGGPGGGDINAVAGIDSMINGWSIIEGHYIPGRIITKFTPIKSGLVSQQTKLPEDFIFPSWGIAQTEDYENYLEVDGHPLSEPGAVQLCPSGYALTGIKGRAAEYVYSLGGFCKREFIDFN